MLTLKPELTLPAVGLTGFEVPLSEEERAIQATVHQFAKTVLRPIGRELDKMSAADVCVPSSPFWSVFQEAAKMGLDPSFFSQFEPDVAVRLESLIGEEMGWGDAGLAASLAVSGFPLQMAMAAGNKELIELCTGKIGCWLITHPDKGSDIYDMKREWPNGAQGNRGNLNAKVGKDEIVLNGQCSAWVSNGVIAQIALAYVAADYGDGYFEADGRPAQVYGAKIPHIDYLSQGSEADRGVFLGAFKEGLREFGWIDGKNVVIDVHWAPAYEFPQLAASLVKRDPAAIVGTCIPSTRAAKNATTTIPVVMSVNGDPVESGLVTSLARPGANVTGTSTLFEELIPKWFEIISTTIPNIRTVAVMANPESVDDDYWWAQAQ
jgi:ABC transporter substrate binding protein